MNCAPVLVTTLNRHTHLIRLVESLRRNTWAKYTDVFIALDYPPTEAYCEGYKKISSYLCQSFDEFKSLNVVYRHSNYGSHRNMLDIREKIMLKYDRFIRTDDDAEFSPNFLEYINKCLDEYETDENVIAVTGYSYPLKWKTSSSATIFKGSFICPMWGTGFWTKKYKRIEEWITKDKYLRKHAMSIILQGGVRRMTDVCRQEFVDLCLSPDFDNTWAAIVTDVSARMYMAVSHKYVIFPTVSKVRNWGFDGSGEFCSIANDDKKYVTAKNYSYHLQTIDEEREFLLVKDSLCDDDTNKAIMNDFDPISLVGKFKVFAKASLFVILGEAGYAKLTLLLRKLR